MPVWQEKMVRLSEIEINRDRHLMDIIRSATASDAINLHDSIYSESKGFTIRPLLLYPSDSITTLLSETISLRRIISEEFDQDSQPYLALSHVIFYLQSAD